MKSYLKYWIFSFAISIAFVLSFLPASVNALGKPFILPFFRNDYEAANQNWSVSGGQDGLIFFGNNDGLLEFDGANWTLWPLPEAMAVRSVACDSAGKIYVGAFEEFGYFERTSSGALEYQSLSEDLEVFHNDEIWRIILHDSKVYFQSFSKIYVYDGKNLSNIDPGGTVVLLNEAAGKLYIHRVGYGLCEITDNKLHLIPGGDVLANDEVRLVLPFGRDSLLLGASEGGLLLWDGKSILPWKIQKAGEISVSEVNNGIRHGEYFIIGTIVNGIYILNKKGDILSHLSTASFLPNNTVLSLASFGPDEFWAGLDRGLALVRLNHPLDFYINTDDESRSTYSAALLDETLWIGTNQGVFEYKRDPLTGYSNPSLVNGTQGQVWELKIIDGELWCGHNSGTYRIRNGAAERISAVHGGYRIREVLRNNSPYLLQSTYSNFAVYLKVNGQWSYSHIMEGFQEPVPDFQIDHNGIIWASHASKGLYMVRSDENFRSALSVRYFGRKDGFPANRNIIPGKIENRVVFCTGKQIFTYDDLNDTIIQYSYLNERLGEFSASNKVVNAGKNHYWFIMDNKIGLYKISAGYVSQIFRHNLASQGAYLVPPFPEISVLSERFHLMCLENGFALFDTARLIENQLPMVALRKISFTGRKEVMVLQPEMENLNARIEIPFWLRNLNVTVRPGYIYSNSLYRYRLSGIDSAWSEWSANSSFEFTRLPARDYRFEVQLADPGGMISQPATFTFRIMRPWYTSAVAIMLYIFLALAGIIFLRISFLKRLRKHQAKLDSEQAEKRKQDKLLAEQEIFRLRNESLQAEIASKSMQLASHTMSLIRKNELLIRLKDELSRQKKELGGRYPNFYYEKLIQMIESNITSEEDWKTFEMHFDQAHENYFRRLMLNYPALTPSDLKLCAYLRLNLASKEIAPLLNISIRGVEIRRYRLRKRLNLPSDANLTEFLLKY